MKTYLWALIQKYFSKELKELVAQENDSIQRAKINYPLEKKVIVRSNEPDDLFIGTIISHEIIHNQLFLGIQDSSGKVIYPMSEPAYWTKEREEALRKLSWDEQINVMNKFYAIGKTDALRKEKSKA